MATRTRRGLGGLSVLALVMGGLLATGCGSQEVKTWGDPQFRPKLLVECPPDMHQPDGMRLDPRTNEMYVAFPNYMMPEYAGVIGKITTDNKLVKVCDMPKHPETGYACPMGMDFGPDGNLYVADNQYFYNKDHKSRVIRVIMKDGKAVRTEVAAEGFKLSNAVMFRGNDLFVTDTFFDLADRPGLTGVYRISMDEMAKGVVKLLPKSQYEKDPHFFMEMHAKPIWLRNDWAGADGMTFDAEGNLYAGNFGDGTLYKATFNPDGTKKWSGVFVCDGRWTCCDGIFYDKQRNCIFVADSEKNAINVIWLPEGKLTKLWENDDTNGADGLLDQPCEPNIRGNLLFISNFDMPFPGLKNTKFDKPYTMSVIDISGLKRPE